MAVKIAEDAAVQLPVLVCHDGFVTSHSLVNVDILDDMPIKDFVGVRKPAFDFLDTKHFD
jgi:pyruvate ferredoxin oxidoreductase alpha subunit